MAIPNERISIYLDNCVKLNISWLEELAKGVSPKRAHEIRRDSKLADVIVKALMYQYKKNILEEME